MIRSQREESCASQQPAAGESAFASIGAPFPCDDSFWKVFDDVCRDFMLTPPQSPPVSMGFDEPLLLDESLSAALDGLLEETSGLSDSGLAQVIDSFEAGDMAILSDCMWSSQPDDIKVGPKMSEREELLLGAFENILVSEEPLVAPETLASNFGDDEEEENEVPSGESSDSEDDQLFVSSCSRTNACHGSESLIDHSYGSTCLPPPPAQKLLTQSAIKPTKRLSSSSSSSASSSSSTSLLSNEYHMGKSKRLAEKRRAKQKLLEADPVTVKFVKRTPATTGSPVARKQAIRCKQSQRKSVTLTSCTERLSSSSPVASTPASQPSVPSSPRVSCPKSPLTKSQTASPCVTSTCPSSPQSILSKKKKEKHFPERRREHNDSEKKRRDQLRNAFLSLRDQIPKLRDQGRRPPRIHILFEAASYVTLLAEKSAYLERIKCSETVKRDKLVRRLRMLQSQ